jgi:hypothetical protein
MCLSRNNIFFFNFTYPLRCLRVPQVEYHWPSLYTDWTIPAPRSEVEGKAKLSVCLIKHHAMETYGKSESTAPSILNLCTRTWMISFKTPPLDLGETCQRYPLERSSVGPQSRSGSDEGETNIYCCRETNPHSPCGLAVTSSLYRLRYASS